MYQLLTYKDILVCAINKAKFNLKYDLVHSQDAY